MKDAFLRKQSVMSQECRVEVAILIQESKADIHVDPLLQRACTVDLLKYCSNVQSGNGRREFTIFYTILDVFGHFTVILIFFSTFSPQMPSSNFGG